MEQRGKTPPVAVGDQITSQGFPGKVLTVSQVYLGDDDWQIVLQDRGVDFCRVGFRELCAAAITGRVARH